MGVKLTIENQAGWNSGIHSNTAVENNKLKLAVQSVTQAGQQVFKSSGTFTVPAGVTAVQVLVVGGGGGGGGWEGGGGGAGGVVYDAAFSVTPGANIAVTIGNGGVGTIHNNTSGQDSKFGTITAKGGGRGGGYDLITPQSGGSGGGGAGSLTTANRTGAAGTSGQGNEGANGLSAAPRAGGGGGGAGAAGGSPSSGVGGKGGNGAYYGDTFGTAIGASGYVAGGGGGWGYNTGGAGGTGGGGAGRGGIGTGTNGTANTGGGGGAGQDYNGGNGGSGLVVVKWAAVTIYKTPAEWLAPSLSLTNITNATESSFITNFNSPAGTSIKFYVAINSSGATAPTAWAEQTPNQIINQIAAGGNYSGKWLWMKIALSATDNTKTPEVSSIIMTVGQYTISDIISYTKKMRAASIREAIMSALGYMKNSRGAIYKIITMVRIPTNYFKPSYGLFRYTLYKWERVWIPLGVFWSGDWDAPENEVYAMTTGRDKLEALRRSEFSTSQVYFDITMYDIAKMVLDSAGMGDLEYWIDEELKGVIIPCFWADLLSHREELRRIAEASLGQIYVDRYGIIRVEGFSFIENYKKEICQEINRSCYYNIDRPVKWTEIANKVEVVTMPRKPSAEENVFRTEVELEGEEAYSFVAFYEDKPVIDISLEIEVKNGNENEIQIDEFTPYVWGAQIAITNKTQVSKEVGIAVKGKVLRVEGRQKIVVEDAESIKENGEILYSFPDNPLIQTPKQARDIANKLIESFTDPRRDAQVSWRGNPSLELGDKILIPDYPDEEIKDEYYIIRQVLEYDGGLISEITARKTE